MEGEGPPDLVEEPIGATGDVVRVVDARPAKRLKPDPAPMRRRKPPRTREWKRRDKVSACTSTNFPWETVFLWLFSKSPRSLVMLQMVDKNLRGLLAQEQTMWVRVYRRYLMSLTAYLTTKVPSPQYPGLSLYKNGLTGIPVHMGKIRTDVDGAARSLRLPPEFDKAFSDYVRKAFALKCVDRCGLCGCRHRHNAYWSLGMRVCQLCMAENTLSNWELFKVYGVHYYDIMREITGKVFCFSAPVAVKQHCAHLQLATSKATPIMFWFPHLEKVLGMPALYQEQKRRLAAAEVLCAVLRRSRVYGLRRKHAKHPLRSPDCLVMRIFNEERKRVVSPYSGRWDVCSAYVNPGDGAWAFWERPVCGKSRHSLRHGEPVQDLAAHLAKWEDVGV
jgi:hypothetical protein